MRVLVVGGAGSGKSAFAERLACELSASRTYVATMAGNGREARERIDRHRRQRAGLGFRTVECVEGSLEAGVRAADKDGVVLLDDLGNLLANAMFLADGSMADPVAVQERLLREVVELCSCHAHAVVVGNLVGYEGRPTDDSTLAWVRAMGSLCCGLAQELDTVVEVVAGVPCTVKGDVV